MTIYAPAMGNQPPAAGNKHLLFIATILGILCTWAIFSYSIDNLDGLGLSAEIKKARTIEIIVFVFGEVFLALAIGRVHKSHPEWATKLAAVWLILLVIDFWGSYQARNAISLHQTLTQSAQKEHAGLIAKQLEVNQTAAKELSDASARQRANKMITGSAQTAMQASKQADNGMELVKAHEAAIKGIKPTEADTFGEWNGTVIFLAVFALYALNTAMWAFIGDFSNSVIAPPAKAPETPPAPAPAPAINHSQTTTPPPADHSQLTTPEHSQTTTPKAVNFDLEKAKAAVRKKSALERMPKFQPWHFAIPALTAASAAKGMEAPKPPVMPAADHSQTTTPAPAKAPRKQRAGMQMDTGTTGKAATRYKRVKALVEARKTRPSINALVALEGEQIGDKRAREYLDAMIRDGVLIKEGNRWNYAPAVDPRQITLGGL